MPGSIHTDFNNDVLSDPVYYQNALNGIPAGRLGKADDIGVKDSVGPMDHTRRMIDLIKPERPDFIVYCGLDENFAHNVLSGGNGAVGGLSNVMPRLCADMKDAVNAKDFEKVAALQQKINRAVVMYGVSVPYIPAVKTVAKLLGVVDCDACRAPIIACDEAQTAALDAIIKSV